MSSPAGRPDACERERLVIPGHGHLVEREAARYRTWHIDRADLRQAGILGLLIAASRFDPRTRSALRSVRPHLDTQGDPACHLPARVPRRRARRPSRPHRRPAPRPRRERRQPQPGGCRAGHLTDDHRSAPPATPHPTGPDDDEELPAPGYTLTDPEHAAVAQDFASTVRTALARIDLREAEALILRYGLDDGPER